MVWTFRLFDSTNAAHQHLLQTSSDELCSASAHLTRQMKKSSVPMKYPTLRKRNALPQLHIWLWSKGAFSVVVECGHVASQVTFPSCHKHQEKLVSRLQKKMRHIIVESWFLSAGGCVKHDLELRQPVKRAVSWDAYIANLINWSLAAWSVAARMRVSKNSNPGVYFYSRGECNRETAKKVFFPLSPPPGSRKITYLPAWRSN